MFIGRERELNSLNRLYESDKFEFVVIYGRRRVGKTALINQFIGNKKAIYFMGVESNAKQNLENISKNIFEYEVGIEAETAFLSFQAALEYVFQLAKDKRLILAIDEYPYVARSSKSLASTLQLLIDKYKDNSKLMLILCGSSMSYMEDHVLAYKAPLYGRRTAQMKILPFDFADTCRYFKNCSDEEKALFYGIVGGTPQYLLQMDDKLSIEDNIKNTFLNPTSSLFEEPENLLKQEVREPALYNAIITAIATGASRMAEISTKVGEDTSVCATYLKNLMALGLILKEVPYGEKASRKSLYAIDDNMFRFWYRFVPENNSVIARGASDLAYRRIQPHFSDYMGKVFEEICKQYLWMLLLNGKSPVEFKELGRWWGTDPSTHSQTEIDIMGEQDKDVALFGECRWINENVDVGVLDKLEERSRLFHYHTVYFYLFAKNGFTKGCMEKATKMRNVMLVTYSSILKLLVETEDAEKNKLKRYERALNDSNIK
ncbi:MAG: ATP-binding protein [Lachnospiraceae bacterium]|jgi:AAA+ ATPase superfamily predicted ATPase|nr:ATP-binding protein [Lachnospiraceae bacterium]